MNHKMYRECVYMYIHNGIIYTIRRVKILILRVEVINKLIFNNHDIILLMLKLVSNTIDTYLTSLLRHERYLFSVFHGILPAIFRRFSKKLSTSVVVHQTIFYQIIKINTIIYRNKLFTDEFHYLK
jgi:hypothetical protein